MRILISSHLFAPSVGGVEQVSGILAEEFCALGHEVRVVTKTPDQNQGQTPFPVFRQPGAAKLFSLVRWCDVYFQNNISFATLWPAWLLRKPVVVTYQTWITQPDGRLLWRDRVKRFGTRFVARNIAISRAIAHSLPAPSTLVPNPYRDDVFFTDATVPRDRELVFLGRLVSDKGAGVLLDALTLLRSRGLAPALTIIGNGPEEQPLRQHAQRSGLSAQVTFAGTLTGPDLRRELGRHRLLVVPSLRAEPFGIVALEGAACGCAVVGSADGGLPDAIGPCGTLFPNGDAAALADRLEILLRPAEEKTGLPAPGIAEHLERHSRRTVAKAYLEIFNGVLKR